MLFPVFIALLPIIFAATNVPAPKAAAPTKAAPAPAPGKVAPAPAPGKVAPAPAPGKVVPPTAPAKSASAANKGTSSVMGPVIFGFPGFPFPFFPPGPFFPKMNGTLTCGTLKCPKEANACSTKTVTNPKTKKLETIDTCTLNGKVLTTATSTASNPTSNGQFNLYQQKAVQNYAEKNVNGTSEPMGSSTMASLNNMMNEASSMMNEMTGSGIGLPFGAPFPFGMGPLPGPIIMI